MPKFYVLQICALLVSFLRIVGIVIQYLDNLELQNAAAFPFSRVN